MQNGQVNIFSLVWISTGLTGGPCTPDFFLIRGSIFKNTSTKLTILEILSFPYKLLSVTGDYMGLNWVIMRLETRSERQSAALVKWRQQSCDARQLPSIK